MSVDFDQQLRAQMELAPTRPRPNVVRDAHRRFRIRRRAARAAVAAGTALAAGVAATVALGDLPGQQRIEPTAYVVSRVNSALAAATNDIIYIQQGGTDVMGDTPYSEGIHYWAYGNQSRELTNFSGAVQDNWDTVTHVKQGIKDVEVAVDHKQRVAIKQTTIIPPADKFFPMDCTGIPGGLPYSTGSGMIENASWMAGYMHTLLGCGGVTATWNQSFDGTKAIKLTGRLGSVTWWIWINQEAYLPIADGYSSTDKAYGSSSERYAWLPPTKANLAYLTGQIPHGFKVITYPPQVAYVPGTTHYNSTIIAPTVWGTGPAATIARRMTTALTVTAREIYVRRQIVIGSPSVAQDGTVVAYPGKTLFEGFQAGKLATETLYLTTPAGQGQERQIQVSVDYRKRQVIRQDSLGPTGSSGTQLPTPSGTCAMAAKGPDPIGFWSGFGMADGNGDVEAVAVRDLLACPHISVTVSWHQRFNGTEAIKVVWPQPAQHSVDTFWLNESTYAVVGVTTVFDPGHPVHEGNAVIDGSSLQLTWLPPTKANLALFNLHIPAGFAVSGAVSG
jgi:hypothetical protein